MAVMWKKWLARGAVVVVVLMVAGVALFGRGGVDPSSFTVMRDGCPHTLWSFSAVDWAPFVQHEGRTYFEQTVRAGEPQLTEQLLDRTVGTVQCMLGDEVQDTGYRTRDGDAAYLAPGTQLWSVGGFDPGFRLAAASGEGLLLFETWPEAVTGIGRDVFGDLDANAIGIAVNADVSEGETTIGRIDDPETVRALVADLLDGPLTSDRHDGLGDRYLLEIEFEGAPPVNLVLFVDERRIHPELVVSQQFIDAILAAVDRN